MKTNSELEREAYIQGNVFLADIYAKMADIEEPESSLFVEELDEE